MSLGYIGSKKSLLSFLEEHIRPRLSPDSVFADLFKEQKHPLFQFAIGNQQTLLKPNIPDVLKEFYDRFYTKDRVAIFTSFDNSKVDVQKIEQVLTSSDQNSEMKSKRKDEDKFLEVKKPEIMEDTFVFMEDKARHKSGEQQLS